MAETAIAASSPAQETPIEIDRGPLVHWTPEQRAEFKRTGAPPTKAPEEKPKTEEPAPSDAEKEPESEPEPEKTEGEPAGETEAPRKQQESRRKPGAEQRIGELISSNKRLKEELEALNRRLGPESRPQPAAAPQQPQQTRSKPAVDDKTPEGKPKYATYEEYVEDLADWKVEQRIAREKAEEAQRAQKRELDAKINEARGHYERFDEVIKPTLAAIVDDPAVHPVVKAMLDESEMLPGLIFTIGSDSGEMASFLDMAKTHPGKALRYIALTESLIREELEPKANGTPSPPARTETKAPKPPSEVGGRNTAPGDELASAARANDFRRFKAEANRRDLARLKGQRV